MLRLYCPGPLGPEMFSGIGALPEPATESRHGTDSELRPVAGLFRRTKLNFAGGQRDYFIIMITEVPVRSYGPIYSSKMSRYE
jgi:hypothetical protein